MLCMCLYSVVGCILFNISMCELAVSWLVISEISMPWSLFQFMMSSPGLMPHKQTTWLLHYTYISKWQKPVSECCARSVVCSTGVFAVAVTGFVEAGWWRPISCQTILLAFATAKRMAITVVCCPFLIVQHRKVIFPAWRRPSSKQSSTAALLLSLAEGFKCIKYRILRTIFCWWWHLLLLRKDVFTSLITKEHCLWSCR